MPSPMGLVAIALLMAIIVAVLTVAGVPHRLATTVAIARGALRLAILSVVLSGVITQPAWGIAALIVMFAVAAVTSSRRIGWSARTLAVVATAMAAGVLTTLVVVSATGALETSARYALAMGGIIIGNAMTATTLAGRRTAASIADHFAEVEAWLSLGATPRQATLEIARHAIREALIPTTDTTKTTGLVVLPGAFVGAIFGGVSPLEAGYFQLLVLAGIFAAATIAATIVALTLAPRLILPADYRPGTATRTLNVL